MKQFFVILILAILPLCFLAEAEVVSSNSGEGSAMQIPSKNNVISQSSHLSAQSRASTSETQFPLIMNMYTRNLMSEYDKTSDIAIRIRIFNANPSNSIQNAFIQVEIPEGFKYIGSNPKGHPTNLSNNINLLNWNLADEEIKYVKYIDYILKTNISGYRRILGAILTATLEDDTGYKNKMAFLSNDLEINILDREPEFKSVDFENPIYIKEGSNLIVSTNVTDPDNDPINCSLLIDNVTRVYPINGINQSKNFSFNLSEFTRKERVFTLMASDGYKTQPLGPFKLITYKFWRYEYLILSPSNLFVFVSILATLFGLIKYKNEIKEFLTKIRQKLGPKRGNEIEIIRVKRRPRI